MQSNLKRCSSSVKNEIIESIKNTLIKFKAPNEFIEKTIQEFEYNQELQVYSFENEFLTFDMGEIINKQIISSQLLFKFKESVLCKIMVVFKLDNSNIIVVYNSDLEIVDYEFKNDFKIEHKIQESNIERNQLLVGELRRLADYFVCEQKEMNTIFEKILSSSTDYSKVVSTKNNYHFNISYNGKLFTISTNLLSTGLGNFSTIKFKEECRITFNESHNIVEVEFNSITVNVSIFDKRRYIFKFDNQLKLKKYITRYLENKKVVNNVILDLGLPLKEFIFIINLKLTNNIHVDELLPELHTPSAYNFNTDSYQDRINIVEMLLC